MAINNDLLIIIINFKNKNIPRTYNIVIGLSLMKYI